MPDDLADALRHRISPEVTAEEFDQELADTAASGLLHELNQAALGDQAVPGLLTIPSSPDGTSMRPSRRSTLDRVGCCWTWRAGRVARVCGWPSRPDATW